jgi:hypothetical protein
MNKTFLVKCGAALAAVFFLATISGRAADAAPDPKAAVLKANAQFYAALNALFTGEVGPMKKVWSHRADVTYMGPDGGSQVSWKKILAEWEKQAAAKLGGAVSPKGVRVFVGSDLAVVQDDEVGKNIENGRSTPVSIRATNIYRLENGTWKMIGHHTDILPWLEKK